MGIHSIQVSVLSRNRGLVASQLGPAEEAEIPYYLAQIATGTAVASYCRGSKYAKAGAISILEALK